MDNADEVRQRMDVLRSNLNTEVAQVASEVRTRSSWRYYVRRYPWASLATAAAVGYAVVPRRIEKVSPDFETIEKLAKQEKLVVAPKSKASETREGLGATLLTLAITGATRAAMGVIAGKMGELSGKKKAQQSEGVDADANVESPRPK